MNHTSSISLLLLSPCPLLHLPSLRMSFPQPMLPPPLTTRATRHSAVPSPLSWAQYQEESLQTSLKNNKMGVQRMKRMQTLFKLWRTEQLLRACLARSCWFVSPPPVTSPTLSVATTQNLPIATSETLKGHTWRTPSLSSCDLWGLLDTPWGPSMEFCQLACRGRSWSVDMLLTPQTTAQTMKMLCQFHKYAKLPKVLCLNKMSA